MVNNKSGFTLIELLVVIFIIGVLAGVVLPNFVSARERARDARRKHDLIEIKNALRLYYNDNQSYPESVSFGEAWSGYMSQIPQDQLEGREYGYCLVAGGDGFVLCALLENTGDQEGVESQELSPCGAVCDCECEGRCYYVCGE